jgi:uncharacterized protein YqgC (DUF456 family)
MNIALLIIFGILSFVGLIGTIVPGLPDTILIFVGTLIYAIFTKFTDISVTTILILAGLTILTNILDWVGAIYGAKKFGASKFGIIGSIVGGIIGLIVFSFIGLIIGAILGTIFAEIYLSKKKYEEALKAGLGVLVGVIFTSIIKIIIAITMIVIFIKDLI